MNFRHSHISMFLVVFAMLKLLSKFDKNGMIHSIKPTIHHERRNTLCLDMWPKLIDHDYYQSLVGSLIFLMHIKLQLSFAMSCVNTYIATPQYVLDVVVRILHYMKGTNHLGSFFRSMILLVLPCNARILCRESLQNIAASKDFTPQKLGKMIHFNLVGKECFLLHLSNVQTPSDFITDP